MENLSEEDRKRIGKFASECSENLIIQGAVLKACEHERILANQQLEETEKAIQEINEQNQELYKQVKEKDELISSYRGNEITLASQITSLQETLLSERRMRTELTIDTNKEIMETAKENDSLKVALRKTLPYLLWNNAKATELKNEIEQLLK